MPSTASDWIAWVAAVGLFLFGGGGVIAWVKQRRDSKNGVRQENRADIDSLNARAVAIVENQFNYLVKPLQDTVDGLKGEVLTCKGEITRLNVEVTESKRKYWSAISHIRTLYVWIARHMPDDLEDTQVPAPPANLAEDI